MYEKYEVATIAGGYVFYLDGVPKAVHTSVNGILAAAIADAVATSETSRQSFALDQVRQASVIVADYVGRGEGNMKIPMIRALRAGTGMGLKDSKNLIEALLP